MSSAFGKWFKLPSLGERLRDRGVREDVVAAAETTAYGRNTDRALPALGALLSPDEIMLKLVEGRAAGHYGIFAVTSIRVVFLPLAEGRGLVLDVPLAQVSEVSWHMHRGLGVVQFAAESLAGVHPEHPVGRVSVDKILGNQAEAIATRIQQAVVRPEHRPLDRDRDPLEVLAELRALHVAGAISDAEFQVRKLELFREI